MSLDDSTSDCDWFDQDEDDLVNNLKSKTPIVGSSTEYIEAPLSLYTDRYKLDGNTNSSKKTVPTAKLREVAKIEAVEAFLFAYTLEFDFFTDQIKPNDSMERVLLYLRVVVLISSLELPGFYDAMLSTVVENAQLIEHFRNISNKLFSDKYKAMWTDTNKVDEMISDMEAFFLRLHRNDALNEQCNNAINYISKKIANSDSSVVSKRSVCLRFDKTLNEILSSSSVKAVDHSEVEIYPTLEELKVTDLELPGCIEKSLLTKIYKNSLEYITVQKHLLREDFMISLRDCVSFLQAERKPKSASNTIYFDDVHIVVNEQFLQANRSQMIFADVLGSRRTEHSKIQSAILKRLSSLKTGSLLCFTTSYDFENLILATVTHIDLEIQSAGLISIDVVRQYNIGSIYDRKLIMFESPAFFEPYNNVFNTLHSFEANKIPMEKYILAQEKVAVAAPAYLQQKTTETPKNVKLNDSQKLAYRSALSQEFCLIQGPPGTGKTYLSVEIVRTLIQNLKGPIVLITYTNESLNKFLLKLSAHTDEIVRFGYRSKNGDLAKFNINNCEEQEEVNPLLKRLYFTTNLLYKEQFEVLQKLYQEFDGTDESFASIVKAQKNLRSISTKLNTIHILFKYYIVRKKQVIAMTTTFAAKTNYLFKLLQSSVVVFEEAAEILESHIVACLTRFTQHVIMIGDHMQLQPFTSSYQHSRVHEMNISLFERLINQNMTNNLLCTQYRMHPEIAELICPIIYNHLENANSVNSYPKVLGMKMNLFFHSHAHEERKDEDEISIYNTYECQEILKLAKHLISVSAYLSDKIVILSPYTKQIAHISKKLHKIPALRSIKAFTVDSFQGMEADIILLSLVRSNKRQDIGFLREKPRICVALSRAKHGLFIIGNLSLLSECSSIWKEIENKLKLNNAIGSGFPYILNE